MKYSLLGIVLVTLISCAKEESTVNTAATEKALVCASCHDKNTRTSSTDAPTFNGLPYEELVTAIEKVNEYHTSQPSLMHDFKEEDIPGIATYFSNAK
ncbi:MAG: c-type cytochrome [Methylotenera sp.]